jgi:hypothetical protein
VLDEGRSMMRGKGGHDVLPIRLPTDGVLGDVELDAAVAIALMDERTSACEG